MIGASKGVTVRVRAGAKARARVQGFRGIGFRGIGYRGIGFRGIRFRGIGLGLGVVMVYDIKFVVLLFVQKGS